MDQLAIPIHTFEPDLVEQLRRTGRLAFLEVVDYKLAFCEMDALACALSYPERVVLFHTVLDHPDTPLFVFEAILLHEICHQVQDKLDIVPGHSPEFWELFHQRVSRNNSRRCEAWVDQQLGPCLDYEEGIRVRSNWRRHYLRKRDSLFDWADREERDWSLEMSPKFRTWMTGALPGDHL